MRNGVVGKKRLEIEVNVKPSDWKFRLFYAYKINIESIDPSKELSMREVYGIDKNQIQ